MRTLILALALLVGGASKAQADNLRWYDCTKEISLLWYVPTNAKALLEDVMNPKRVSECVRVKIKERTMMIAALEPAVGAKTFPKDTLLTQLQGTAGKKYVVVHEHLPSLNTAVYRGLVHHSLIRRPTLVSIIEVTKTNTKYRLAITFYGNEVTDAEIEDAFGLLRKKLAFSCTLPLCRRPLE